MDFTKPRVAIYYYVVPQTGFRNDGPPLFLNYNLRKILNNGNIDMGDHDGNVVHLMPTPQTDKFGNFDLNILVDHGEDAIGVPLDWEIPHPNAYWVSDAHLGYKYRMERAKQFDFVFVCQKRFIDEFVRDGVPREKIFYLPHAAEPDVYKPYSIIEKWKWCFIGHLNNSFRIDLVDRFCKEWPVGLEGYLGWRMGQVKGHNVLDDVARKFAQSKVILNENIQDNVNMRTFEALACKKALLTEDIPELHGLFIPSVHLITYKSIDDAVEKAKLLLDNDEWRESIANHGYNEFINKHTYRHRAESILKTCLNYEAPKGELAHAH